jgi:enoyl-CoA hydratase/3-hydroxyacyl-CoA dehydrogenase
MMKTNKNDRILVEETISSLKERRGGVANLILAALLLEATRMIDDGFDVAPVEEAAKKAFGIPKGFLSNIDDLGIPKVVDFMEYLSDTTDAENDLRHIYDNFFTPSKSLKEIHEKSLLPDQKPAVVWVTEADAKKTVYDFMLVETLGQRFKAVVFITATELVESGIIELSDLEKHCTNELKWKEGPFSMMNSIGVGEALKIVTERMFFSHRKEINFPVPRLLITHAQKNTPWLVYPKN